MKKGLTSFKKGMHRLGLLNCWVCRLPMDLLTVDKAEGKQWNRHVYGICQDCLELLPLIDKSCDYCGVTLPKAPAVPICGSCVKKKQSGFFISACDYQFPINQLIHQFKFNQALGLVDLLGELLAERVQGFYGERNLPLPDLVLSVPLHKKRFWKRGYNQADVLANYCAKTLSIDFQEAVLSRVDFNRPQTGLSGRARFNNVKGAFLINEFFLKKINNQYVALVDDVKTTGATVEEIRRLLLKAGCRQVDIWVLANTSDGSL